MLDPLSLFFKLISAQKEFYSLLNEVSNLNRNSIHSGQYINKLNKG